MNRTRMIVITLVALIASGVVTLLAYRMLSRRLNPTAEDLTKIVVAAEELHLGNRLTALQLRMVPWPKATSLEGSFFDPEEIVGRGVIVPMIPNEPVLESKLAPREAGAGLTTAIPEGMRAVAIKVNDVIGIAGFVLPGTRVDVIVVGSPDERKRNDTSKMILENIVVLAAGQNIEQGIDGEPQAVQVITLLVTPVGAEKLALASVDGRLQLALRHPLDLDLNDPAPVKKADLYTQAATSSPPPVRRVSRPRPTARPKVVAVKPPVPRLFEVELIQGSDREIFTFEVIPK
ncbi:MAG: Flp pilus assembly protein CpaB [Acidobacteria bacterium]|nr:Flp pilus assembly protein CpaB [Acidobacteriota bacterium]